MGVLLETLDLGHDPPILLRERLLLPLQAADLYIYIYIYIYVYIYIYTYTYIHIYIYIYMYIVVSLL